MVRQTCWGFVAVLVKLWVYDIVSLQHRYGNIHINPYKSVTWVVGLTINAVL